MNADPQPDIDAFVDMLDHIPCDELMPGRQLPGKTAIVEQLCVFL